MFFHYFFQLTQIPYSVNLFRLTFEFFFNEYQFSIPMLIIRLTVPDKGMAADA